MTDWAATGQMLSGIGTIGGAIALLVAAYLGKSAVSDFEKQRKAERRMEHAESALTAAYQIQSAIESVRSPMSTSNELESSKEELSKTEWFGKQRTGEQQRSIQSNVFYQRIRFFQSAFDNGLEKLPYIKAYFGKESEQSMRDLIHARHSVRVYADAYMQDTGQDAEHSKTVKSYIWDKWNENDPVRAKVEAAIAQLESVLLPVITSSEPSVSLVKQEQNV